MICTLEHPLLVPAFRFWIQVTSPPWIPISSQVISSCKRGKGDLLPGTSFGHSEKNLQFLGQDLPKSPCPSPLECRIWDRGQNSAFENQEQHWDSSKFHQQKNPEAQQRNLSKPYQSLWSQNSMFKDVVFILLLQNNWQSWSWRRGIKDNPRSQPEQISASSAQPI